MKRKGLLLLAAIIVMVAFGWQSANAQQTVATGSAYTYTYTQTASGSTLGWAVTGPASVTTSSTTTTQAITWPATTGAYTITVTETNGASCTATTTYTVTVGSRTIEFASTTAGPICSTPGTDYTTTVNFSVAMSASELPATVPVTIAGNNGTAGGSVSATLTGIGVAPYSSATLTIPNASNDFEANTNASAPMLNQDKTITLTATTDGMGGTLGVGTNNVQSVTIDAKPVTSTITHN